MGDQVKIPRSFADHIGVADTLPSIRRHYMNLYTGGLTTGLLWPGVNAAGMHATTIMPANGLPLFQRNFTVERGLIATWGNTTSSATTVHHVDIMGGGTTICRLPGRLWNNTTTMHAVVASTTPMNPNVAATTPIRIVCVRKGPFCNRATIFMVGREALD